MAEVNLLDQYPFSDRPIEERGQRKLAGSGRISRDPRERDNLDLIVEYKLLNLARKFGKEYFDGDRLYGYGGYHYQPRFWRGTVQRLRDYYGLSETSTVLDVGCAKGFMMYDFKQLMPNMTIAGVDISEYAYENAIKEMRPYMRVGNVKELPHKDKSFDLVVSINTVDHLPLEECKQAIREIQRVTKKHAFISVNTWRTDRERDLLLQWNLTALTSMSVDDWKNLFDEVGYRGDYWWFIAQ